MHQSRRYEHVHTCFWCLVYLDETNGEKETRIGIGLISSNHSAKMW